MRRAGFTVLELLVVMLIMGLAVAIAIPRLGWIPGPAAETTLGDVVSLLRSARVTSVTRGKQVQVTIDPERSHYWIEIDYGDGLQLESSGTLQERLGEHLLGQRHRLVFRFDPRGFSYGDSIAIGGARMTQLHLNHWSGGVGVREQ